MNEYPGLVDSHFHLLSLEEKGLDPSACVAELFAAGARWGLDAGVETAGWEKRLKWGAAEPRLLHSAGVHPAEAPVASEADFTELEVQLSHPKCVAVGEIGLDWSRGRDDEAAQRSVFRRQLALAADRGLPIVIHNRGADRELLEELDAANWKGQGIQHCFSSDRAFARQALDRGFCLSFAGNLTYKSSPQLRDVAAWAPADRILVETDAPYLAPQNVRGRPSRPIHAGLTATALAELRGCSLGDLLQITADTFERVFGLQAH